MRLEKINPTVKAGVVLFGAVLLSFQYSTMLNLSVFVISVLFLLFFSKAGIRNIIGLLLPAFAAAFGLFMMGLYYAKDNAVGMTFTMDPTMMQNVSIGLQLSTRLLSFAGLGLMFALTTDGEFFMRSLMRQCHLSPKFAYGMLAAFNLMPVIKREYVNVKKAYELRGIGSSNFSVRPVFTMLVNTVRWSESIAMAMESKGFCADAPRSYYYLPEIKGYDIAFAIFWLAIIIIGFILKFIR